MTLCQYITIGQYVSMSIGFRRNTKNSSKIEFLYISVLHDSVKTACLKKNLVLQLWLKMISTSQIAVFFDHQYLWKESIDLLNFVHGHSHQVKVASGITSCDSLWSVVPLVQSDCRILQSSDQFSGKNQVASWIFACSQSSREGSI